MVQPAGCASPTYIGMPLILVRLLSVLFRLAASTLSKMADPSYPDFSWDVAIVDLRDDSDRRIAPDDNSKCSVRQLRIMWRSREIVWLNQSAIT